jgi:agmatinase
MNDSRLQNNFGGIDEKFSQFNFSKVVILPAPADKTVSNNLTSGVSSIIKASQNLELYEEETDAEVYKIGIHTLENFNQLETIETTQAAIYQTSKELISNGKFLCTIGDEHSISFPLVRAHSEKYYDLSVLNIGSQPKIRDEINENKYLSGSVMSRIIRELNIPTVQFGIRSISADEAILLDEIFLTKIIWAKDIIGQTNWIVEVMKSLTANVYLNIDVNAFETGLITPKNIPEPGGIGWYDTLALIRQVADKRRIVGMDLVEYSPTSGQSPSSFLCAKLIYKTLAYIFKDDTPKVRKISLTK